MSSFSASWELLSGPTPDLLNQKLRLINILRTFTCTLQFGKDCSGCPHPDSFKDHSYIGSSQLCVSSRNSSLRLQALISTSDFKTGLYSSSTTVPASSPRLRPRQLPPLVAQDLRDDLDSAISFIQSISTSFSPPPQTNSIVWGSTTPQLPPWPPQAPHGI